MSKTKDSQGFIHLHVLIPVLLVVGIVGFAGYTVAHHNFANAGGTDTLGSIQTKRTCTNPAQPATYYTSNVTQQEKVQSGTKAVKTGTKMVGREKVPVYTQEPVYKTETVVVHKKGDIKTPAVAASGCTVSYIYNGKSYATQAAAQSALDADLEKREANSNGTVAILNSSECAALGRVYNAQAGSNPCTNNCLTAGYVIKVESPYNACVAAPTPAPQTTPNLPKTNTTPATAATPGSSSSPAPISAADLKQLIIPSYTGSSSGFTGAMAGGTVGYGFTLNVAATFKNNSPFPVTVSSNIAAVNGNGYCGSLSEPTTTIAAGQTGTLNVGGKTCLESSAIGGSPLQGIVTMAKVKFLVYSSSDSSAGSIEYDTSTYIWSY